MKRAFLWVIVLGLAACRGCAGPEAPDEYVIGRIVDPYQRVPRTGPMRQQARAVLDDVSDQLGYGKVPGDVLAAHAGEAWADRLALLLSHGGTEQLAAAWTDLRVGITEGFRVPSNLKLRVRQAEARIYALQHQEADEETMRHAYLAEIAWVLVLQHQSKTEAPAP